MADEAPLTEATFLILLCLVVGPRHGYAIMQEVTDLSTGRVVFSTGTLYGALKRLLELGWIERLDSADDENTGRPRKEYRLTALGRHILTAETNRLVTLANLAQRRLAGGEA